MAVIADLMARLGVDITDFQAGMSKVDSMMRNAQGASTALLAGVAVVATGMAAFGVKSIIAAGQLEQTTVAFTTMLGSAEKSASLLKELQTFAATTPFEFTEITAASKKLLAFGVNAEDITSTLRSLGDVSSGIGAPIGEIAELYGKAKTQGRLFAEDINQLTGRGIPIIGELAKQFNVSESEVRGLVESGQVGFPNLQLAFENMTAAGGQFGGLMEAQAQTLPGMWSNLMDAIGQSSVVLGQELIKTFDLKDKLAGVISGLSEITALLQSEGLMGALDKIFNEKTQLAIVVISGAIAAALIPALWGLVLAIGAGVLALAPFIVIGAAVSALAYTIYKNWEPISAFFANTWTSISTTVTNAWNGIINFFTGAWSRLTTAITGGFDSAISFITNLPGQAWQWGADIINGIVQGIKDAAWAVGNAVSGVAQTIRNFLHFSVPDEGPLVDFQSWMPDFMGGLAEGITNSKYLVTNAMKGLSTDMNIGVNTNIASGNVGGSTGGSKGGNSGSSRPQSINVIVELDSRTLLKALGQPLADTIRLKASAIF